MKSSKIKLYYIILLKFSVLLLIFDVAPGAFACNEERFPIAFPCLRLRVTQKLWNYHYVIVFACNSKTFAVASLFFCSFSLSSVFLY